MPLCAQPGQTSLPGNWPNESVCPGSARGAISNTWSRAARPSSNPGTGPLAARCTVTARRADPDLAVANGSSGAIINGAVRDRVAIGALDFGVKALGSDPSKKFEDGILVER